MGGVCVCKVVGERMWGETGGEHRCAGVVHQGQWQPR